MSEKPVDPANVKVNLIDLSSVRIGLDPDPKVENNPVILSLYGSMSTKVASPQIVGGYTFVLIGDLDDGTKYRRLVWEVTDPRGKKPLMIRGYGSAETSTEPQGKTSVQVER